MAWLKKRSARNLTRVFLASDLHGSTRCFEKFLRAIDFYEADVLMIAGDLTGKMIVPILEESSGRWISTFQGREQEITADALLGHEEVIESAGLYPYRTSREEVAYLEEDPSRVDTIFHDLVRRRVERWVEMAETRLAAADKDCYFVAGNDDYPEIDPLLEQGDRFKFVDGRRAVVGDTFELIGLGVSNVTPWNAPRDVSEDEIAARLSELTGAIERPESAIYLIHVPPAGSTLDLAPELDADLRPTGAGDNMIHVGSTAVAACIKETQPMLTLHGHIHESRGIYKMGKTTSLNPGSEYGEGILRGAIVNVEPGKVASHLFVSG
jgi:uncharacterized protein